jgi:hypothetical protein
MPEAGLLNRSPVEIEKAGKELRKRPRPVEKLTFSAKCDPEGDRYAEI